jgi:phenylacetate-coenzyme A ligase PaaK-like adenylate-forming protein
MAASILDLDIGTGPDPDEFVRAAMEWHFSPDTGSPFWLRKATSLPFDPRADIKGLDDLARFPNVADELRDVRGQDLIPRGYGADPGLVGVYESGGTTGPPKRVVVLHDWWDRYLAWSQADLDAKGFPRNVSWLTAVPTGPHLVGEMAAGISAGRGGLKFSVDMDPRWVKKLIAAGRADEASAYADHLLEQFTFLLRTQDIGVIMTTPPLLERIARHDDLVEVINERVHAIFWGGTQMDADTRYLYRTEVFPDVTLQGLYGSTMILGGSNERAGLTDADPCVFDPPAPFVTLGVVDPETGRTVDYGERGQVVMNHVSKNLLLPNNRERDIATRMRSPAGQAGDSVADVAPAVQFGSSDVIEGVY